MKWLNELLAFLKSLMGGADKTPPITAPKKPAKRKSKKPEKTSDTDVDVIPLEEPPVDPPQPIQSGASWYKLAQDEEGTKEIRGAKHNPKVVKYFAEAGFAGIKDDETAWCAAFANAMLERAGYAGSKSLAARSFLNWGKKLKRPKMGCIVVFKRGNSSWQGHVGFYAGENKTHIYVLGGNQRNMVNVSRYPKSKFLGYRWPSTMAGSRTMAASVSGASGTGMAGFAEAMLPFARELQTLSEVLYIMKFAGALIALVSFGIIMYARYDDWKKKGR